MSKSRRDFEQWGLQTLIDSLDTLIAYVDRRQRYVYVNRAYETHWGRPLSEIIGLHVSELLGPDAYESAREFIERALDGQIQRCEVDVLWKGRNRRVLASYVPHLDSSGEVLGFFATSVDISDARPKRSKLQQARDAAEQANRAKSRFLANMSHEIRTPLNAIIGFSELLVREGHLSPVQSDYVNTILNSGEHLLSIVNDVLELSKIEAGMARVERMEFELLPLVEEVLHMFEARVVDRPITLRLEPGRGADVCLQGDPAKIRQILINLLNNALKFTDEGMISVRIWSRPEPESESRRRVRLEVKDTGCGIPDDQLDLIFDDFAQVRNGRDVEGTGLGLPLCRSFAELMDGKLSVESEVGVGSTFVVNLYLDGVVNPPDELTDDIDASIPSSPRFKGLDRFRQLPHSVRSKIVTAANAANMDALEQEVAEVRDLDASLAGLLENLLRRYDFQSILELEADAEDRQKRAAI